MLVSERHMRSFMKHLSTKKYITFIYIFGVLFFLGSAVFGMLSGASHISISDLFQMIVSRDKTSPVSRIFLYVRFPRVLASLACGAALSVSGAVIQGVLNNRLASPGLIGINSGAGLAVTLCAAFGVLGGFRVALFSFLGSFAAVLLISLGAKKWNASAGTLILMGVALNSLLGAISDTVTTFFPEVSISNNDFKIGDFSAVTYVKLVPSLLLISISLLLLFTLSVQLDVLTLGEDSAKGLGMNTTAIRVIFLILSALLAGSAVSVCGLLSFVGLLVPHAVRRIAGGAAKHLLPLSALLGGGFVTLSDTLARTVFAPYEIPVGIIMAFIGTPFFTFILIKRRRGEARD